MNCDHVIALSGYQWECKAHREHSLTIVLQELCSTFIATPRGAQYNNDSHYDNNIPTSK